MTDEKLIEEAADAFDDAPPWMNRETALRFARAALEVFEKALGEATVTPTDDERGALTNKATTPDGRLEHHLLEGEAVTMYPYWAADLRTVIAGFRRSVVPEPSGDDYPDAEGLATLRVQSEPSDAHEIDRMGICRRCGQGITAAELLDGQRCESVTVQGEPSDAQEEAAAKAIFAEEQCDRQQKRNAESIDENWNSRLDDRDRAEYRSLARAALPAEARPFDTLEALVDAARSVPEEPFNTWRYRMTAALRAASAVTEQGENR